MMNSWIRAAVVAVLIGYTGSAAALIDAQLMHGRRWFSNEEDGEKSGSAYRQTMAAAHVGLLPVVAFGVSYSLFDGFSRAEIPGTNETGYELGLDVIAALTLIPLVTPYARFNLPILSQFDRKGSGVNAQTEVVPVQSYWMTAGIKIPVLPLFSVNMELGTGVYMTRISTYKVNGKNLLNEPKNERVKDRFAQKIDQFLVGVEFNF